MNQPLQISTIYELKPLVLSHQTVKKLCAILEQINFSKLLFVSLPIVRSPIPSEKLASDFRRSLGSIKTCAYCVPLIPCLCKPVHS